MEPTAFALPGGLTVRAGDGVALLEEAAERGCAPLFVTEVAVNDATAVLAAVAARRTDVPLGSAILPLGSRSLATVAMSAATIAGLSEAEVLLGVGVSTPPIVDGWHGAAWTPSVEATRERLLELRRLLDGERRGSFRLGVAPGERVRVLLGALGPRMVELGLEVAGGVICNLTPPEQLPAPVAGGRVYAFVWVATEEGALQAGRRDLVAYATTGPYARHFRRLGFGAVVDEVAALRAEGRLREAPDRLPAEFVERLVVRSEALADHAARVRAAGAVPIVLPFVPAGANPVAAARKVVELVPAAATRRSGGPGGPVRPAVGHD